MTKPAQDTEAIRAAHDEWALRQIVKVCKDPYRSPHARLSEVEIIARAALAAAAPGETEQTP
jgi:hypothetical protein